MGRMGEHLLWHLRKQAISQKKLIRFWFGVHRYHPPPTPSLLRPLSLAAKEKEGSFKEAKEAYEKAGDLDSVVRLNVEQLPAGPALLPPPFPLCEAATRVIHASWGDEIRVQ